MGDNNFKPRGSRTTLSERATGAERRDQSTDDRADVKTKDNDRELALRGTGGEVKQG